LTKAKTALRIGEREYEVQKAKGCYNPNCEQMILNNTIMQNFYASEYDFMNKITSSFLKVLLQKSKTTARKISSRQSTAVD